VAAYALCGLFPLHFKTLQSVPEAEILAHQMAQSLLFCALLPAIVNRWYWPVDVVHRPRVLATLVSSAAPVTVNWGSYIWTANAYRVTDASLGYFINPLVDVPIGALFPARAATPPAMDRGLGWPGHGHSAAPVCSQRTQNSVCAPRQSSVHVAAVAAAAWALALLGVFLWHPEQSVTR
jgi:hypothetical protein